jgi:hypothetical protein
MVCCRLAVFLADLTARPPPASAAASSTTSTAVSARRRHLPRLAARPLARRNAVSRAVSAGKRPGSAVQTRAACLAASSWMPRYKTVVSLFSCQLAVSSASLLCRIKLVWSSSIQARSRGQACSRTSCAIPATSVPSTSRLRRAKASRTAPTAGHWSSGALARSSALVTGRLIG